VQWIKLSFVFRNWIRLSHDAVISVYDAAGNAIETHEHAGDFKKP